MPIPNRTQNVGHRSRYGSWVTSAAIASALGFAMVQTAQADTRQAAKGQVQAQAAQPAPQQAPLPGMQAAPKIPQKELQTFADATVEVKRIDDAYQPRLEAAKSPEEQAQVQNEAMSEMVRAVEAKGMSVERYNTISQVAQVNPDVARQIYQYIDKKR